LLVQAQCLGAGVGQRGGGGRELRVHLGQLLLGVVQQALVQGLGLSIVCASTPALKAGAHSARLLIWLHLKPQRLLHR
jgi:hypothetical protein